ATTMTPSHGARETSLIRDDFWCGPLDPPIARMSTIQIRPASVSASRSHWASAISRPPPVTLSRGGARARRRPPRPLAPRRRPRAARRAERRLGLAGPGARRSPHSPRPRLGKRAPHLVGEYVDRVVDVGPLRLPGVPGGAGHELVCRCLAAQAGGQPGGRPADVPGGAAL